MSTILNFFDFGAMPGIKTDSTVIIQTVVNI